MNAAISFLPRILNLLLVLLAFACSNDREALPKDNAYFPLEAGRESEFIVEQTTYTAGKTPETRRFTSRHTITNTFTGLDGNLTYNLEFTSNKEQAYWVKDSASIMWRSIDKAYIQENGQTVVKMIFPLTDGTAWNGNEYNALPETIFRYSATGKPSLVNGIEYPKTITIIRQDDSTLLSRNKYVEIYAADIGLISTEKVFIKYCNTPDCIGKGIVNSGYQEISALKTFSKK